MRTSCLSVTLKLSKLVTSVLVLLARVLHLDNGPGPVSESDDDQIISRKD